LRSVECPSCGTVFEVVEEKMSASLRHEGRVRCYVEGVIERAYFICPVCGVLIEYEPGWVR